jgi:PilZ domain
MATQDFMSKAPQNGIAGRVPIQTERRGSRRCKITQLMRIRPSDPEKENFDDMRGTVSVSRSGVYFQTSETTYEIGMRLFVTMPYSHEAHAMTREYLCEVVRVDRLPNGMTGVGFKILMEIGMQAASYSGHSVSRK